LDASEDTDDALVLRAGRGDRLAASRLIARHSAKILSVCLRTLGDRSAAEDCAQETFLKLWRTADRWKPGAAKIETWLYRVATNACIDRLRRKRPDMMADEVPDVADEAPLADAGLIAAERRRTVDQALGELPNRQRLAIVLCHYEEMSNAQAAAVMNVSVEALESLLSRARRRLKESLAPLGADLIGGARQ